MNNAGHFGNLLLTNYCRWWHETICSPRKIWTYVKQQDIPLFHLNGVNLIHVQNHHCVKTWQLRDIISFAVVLGSSILACVWNYYFILQNILLAYNKIWIIWYMEYFLSDMKGKSSLNNFNMLRLGMCLHIVLCWQA